MAPQNGHGFLAFWPNRSSAMLRPVAVHPHYGQPRLQGLTIQEPAMTRYWRRSLLILGLTLCGCTSDPNAAVNQAFPIRQMDAFFNSLPPSPPPPPPDYTHQPGYAPAYPEYAPQLSTGEDANAYAGE
jgi:hypothetical protein